MAADTKISALSAIGTAAGTDEFMLNEAGTSKKMTLADINTYSSPLYNGSVSTQTLNAGDTYLVGSSIAVPNGRLRAKTMYRVRFEASKTAAGAGQPAFSVRLGTAGTTSDTTVANASPSSNQTNTADNGTWEVRLTFQTVGSGTSAVIQFVTTCKHLAAGGFSLHAGQSVTRGGSAGFNSTVSNTIIGLSVDVALSAVWTVTVVQSELLNLTP